MIKFFAQLFLGTQKATPDLAILLLGSKGKPSFMAAWWQSDFFVLTLWKIASPEDTTWFSFDLNTGGIWLATAKRQVNRVGQEGKVPVVLMYGFLIWFTNNGHSTGRLLFGSPNFSCVMPARVFSRTMLIVDSWIVISWTEFFSTAWSNVHEREGNFWTQPTRESLWNKIPSGSGKVTDSIDTSSESILVSMALSVGSWWVSCCKSMHTINLLM